MRQDTFSELKKFENSLGDMFPRLVDCQKDIELIQDDTTSIIQLKHLDFLERLQKKMSGYTQYALNRCDIIEIALKQLINSI